MNFIPKILSLKHREVFPEMSRRFQANNSAFSLKCREVFRQCFLFLTPLRSASGGGVVLVSLRNQFRMEKNPRSFGKHKGLFCVILIDFGLFIENNISMFLSDTGWHFKGASMPQW